MFKVQVNQIKQTGRVEGITGVANVLRAVKDAKGQSGHKVPRGEVASHWTQLKACPLCNSSALDKNEDLPD